jgi:hypothetical protein
MPFTGVPVITKVSDQIYRIAGISLDAGELGTIGMLGQISDVPVQGCNWGPYQGQQEPVVSLTESIEVNITFVETGLVAVPLHVTKNDSGLIAIANGSAGDDSPEFEVYIKYHT